MPYAKQNVKVKVSNFSGFDKSFRNSGSLTCGTITPILCDEVIPNSRVSLKVNIASQLPPLASDTYMNCKLKVEAFFTPMRLLCRSFENFFCDFPKEVISQAYVDKTDPAESGYYSSLDSVSARVPLYTDSTDPLNAIMDTEPGSLLDYLGYRTAAPLVASLATTFTINLLPMVNYHLVWQEYYRNPRVQKPAFAEPIYGQTMQSSLAEGFNPFQAIPYTFFHDDYLAQSGATIGKNYLLSANSSDDLKLVDGVGIDQLRQRNFGLDYFTSARVSPQQGAAAAVSFNISDNQGSFTIAQLRAQNSLQQFRERNNLASPRLVDQVLARYGANLSDGVAQRPICIGSATYDVASRSVDQTAVTSSTPSSSNPFNAVAAQYGRAYGVGSDFIIKDFTANEPGYILVNVTLVPEVTYSNGNAPMFNHYRSAGSITDMACSILQNVGDQPIYVEELLGIAAASGDSNIFGYTDRYADFMYIPNQAHGELRESGTLSSFVLQRSFSNAELSSSFLEIPKTYLDSVFAVSTGVSKLSAWYDAMLDYRVVMPLAEYSLPSLQDPAYEHGHTVSLRRNGQIF